MRKKFKTYIIIFGIAIILCIAANMAIFPEKFRPVKKENIYSVYQGKVINIERLSKSNFNIPAFATVVTFSNSDVIWFQGLGSGIKIGIENTIITLNNTFVAVFNDSSSEEKVKWKKVKAEDFFEAFKKFMSEEDS